MTTHSSILAWRILMTEEPGGLQSVGSRIHTGCVKVTKLGLKPPEQQLATWLPLFLSWQ